MDLKKIERILQLMRSYQLHELEISEGHDKLRVTSAPGIAGGATFVPAPMPLYTNEPSETPPVAPHIAPVPRAAPKGNQKYIRSPFVGTYYSAPSPGSEPFVRPGQRVKKGEVLCIIEAMKLMNEIEAENDAAIVDVLVENGQSVEFDQPLFVIE